VLVTPVVPGASGFGLRMRSGLLFDALAGLGPVEVVVVPVHGPVASAEEAGTTVVPVDRAADERADFMARLAQPETRETAVALHPRPALCRSATLPAAEVVADLVGGADLVLVTRLYLAPFLDLVLAAENRPVCVLDVDDVESSTRSGFGDPEEAERFDRLERHYVPRFDRVLSCKPVDAQDLAERCGGAADVVPNAVLPVDLGPPVEPRWDLLFVGNLSYRPNIDAVTWLCERVLPDLPSVSVGLVGHRPPPEVLALAQPDHVEVIGTVPDVAPFYAAGRVAVVPLLSGGGTSIKVPEAMAHGRPVVATRTGARGLSVRDGAHLLLADDPASFAVACRRLLDDPRLADRLATAGRRLVRTTYTTDVVADRLADLLRATARPS
jgi:polysaccharide biosynthesis protein PslH